MFSKNPYVELSGKTQNPKPPAQSPNPKKQNPKNKPKTQNPKTPKPQNPVRKLAVLI